MSLVMILDFFSETTLGDGPKNSRIRVKVQRSTDHNESAHRTLIITTTIFSLIETETSTSVHYNNSKKIPGIIVTDANENDQLIDDLLLLDTFKSKVGDFLSDGIKNGKPNTLECH